MMDVFRADKKNVAAAGFLLFILVGNAFFLNYNAFRFFNTLDMGGFLDASWRVFRGQRPYVDFIYYTGPLYLYLNAFFFHLLGFGKAAVFTDLIAVHSAVILLVFFMLYKRVPLGIACAVTALTVPSFYWSVSFPWHDQTAHLWGIIGVSLLVWQLPFRTGRRAFALGAACGFLNVLILMTKSNIGTAYGVLFVLVLLGTARKVPALAGYAAGILAGGIAALGLVRFPKEFLDQSLTYSSSDGIYRILSLASPANWLVNGYWIAPLIVLPFLFLFLRGPKPWERALLFFGITFVGIFSANTGGMIKEANNFLWGVQMAMAFLTLEALRPNAAGRGRALFRGAQGLLLILTAALTVIAVRYGLQLKTWTYATKHPAGNYALKSEPLKGWKFHEPEGAPLDEFVKYIKANVPRDDTLLNLTDMYLIYALTGRDSFRGISFLISGNLFPAPGKQQEQVRDAILTNLPDWVIIHYGSLLDELMFLRLQETINKSYVPVARVGLYILLRKKPWIK